MFDVQQQTDALGRLGYDIAARGLSACMKQFQRYSGLVADGVYGPKTDAVLARRFKSVETVAHSGEFRVFRLTRYYVTDEADYSGPTTIPVYDKDRKVIRKVGANLFANMALEGTGRFSDGALLNVDGQYVPVSATDYAPVKAVYDAYVAMMAKRGKDPKPSRYFGIDVKDGQVVAAQKFYSVPEAKHGKGYGIGHLGVPYEPFRTLATDIGAYSTSDPRFKGKGGLVPSGTKVFIAEFVGLKLPDETTHDGWFVANDTGGGIYQAHFDGFSGSRTLLAKLRQLNGPSADFDLCHAWFSGIEGRMQRGYSGGLDA